MRRCSQVVGHGPDQGDGLGMVVMIGPHYRDRMLDTRPAARAHGREQDHFLLGHMALHFLRQGGEGAGQPTRRIGIVRVNPFDPFRKRQERRKLCAVSLMIPGQDVVDQGAGLLRGLGYGEVFHRWFFRWIVARVLRGPQ